MYYLFILIETNVVLIGHTDRLTGLEFLIKNFWSKIKENPSAPGVFIYKQCLETGMTDPKTICPAANSFHSREHLERWAILNSDTPDA